MLFESVDGVDLVAPQRRDAPGRLAAAAQALGQAVGNTAAGVGGIIPSGLIPFTSSSKSISIGSQESLIANSPNVSMADNKPKPAELTKSENSLYIPE